MGEIEIDAMPGKCASQIIEDFLHNLKMCKRNLQKWKTCRQHAGQETEKYLHGHFLCEKCNYFHHSMATSFDEIQFSSTRPRQFILDGIEQRQSRLKTMARDLKKMREQIQDFAYSSNKKVWNDQLPKDPGDLDYEEFTLQEDVENLCEYLKIIIFEANTVVVKLRNIGKLARSLLEKRTDISRCNRLLKFMENFDQLNNAIKCRLVEVELENERTVAVQVTVEPTADEENSKVEIDNTICQVIRSDFFHDSDQLLGVHSPVDLAKLVYFDQLEVAKVNSDKAHGLVWLKDEAQMYKVDVYLAYYDVEKVNARISIIEFKDNENAQVYWIDYGAVSIISTEFIQIPLQPALVRYTPPLLTWVKLENPHELIERNTQVKLQELTDKDLRDKNVQKLSTEQKRQWNAKFSEHLGVDVIAIGDVVQVSCIEIIGGRRPMAPYVSKMDLDQNYKYFGKVQIIKRRKYDFSKLEVKFKAESRETLNGTKIRTRLSNDYCLGKVRTGLLNLLGKETDWNQDASTHFNEQKLFDKPLDCSVEKEFGQTLFTAQIHRVERVLQRGGFVQVDEDESEEDEESNADSESSSDSEEQSFHFDYDEMRNQLNTELQDTLNKGTSQCLFDKTNFEVDTFYKMKCIRVAKDERGPCLMLMIPVSEDLIDNLMTIISRYQDSMTDLYPFVDQTVVLRNLGGKFKIVLQQRTSNKDQNGMPRDIRFAKVACAFSDAIDTNGITFWEEVEKKFIHQLPTPLANLVVKAHLSEDLVKLLDSDFARKTMKTFVQKEEVHFRMSLVNGYLTITHIQASGQSVEQFIREKACTNLTFETVVFKESNKIVLSCPNFDIETEYPAEVVNVLKKSENRLETPGLTFKLLQSGKVNVHTLDGSIQPLDKFMRPVRKSGRGRALSVTG